jgi:hypothetical protein
VSWVELNAAPGLTLTAQLFALDSDAVVDTAASVTEQSETKGSYLAEVSSALRGAHLVIAYSAGTAVSAQYVHLTDDAVVVHRAGNYADVVAAEQVELIRKAEQNRQVTNPIAGTFVVYDDDGTTPLLEADLFETVSETQRYRGRGAEVRGRLR